MITRCRRLISLIRNSVHSASAVPSSNLSAQEKLTRFYLKYYLEIHGATRSLERREPCTNANAPLPWYTYSAIDYLNGLDFSQSTVLEFGSGASSIYWLNKSHRVTSIESDIAWYQSVKNKTKENENHDLRYATAPSEYILSGEDISKYDVIIIDGKYRYDCATRVALSGNPEVLVIFDNADWYPNAIGRLMTAGFFRVDFIGPGPINAYPWSTSILLKRGKGIKHRTVRPIVPLGLENWKGNSDDHSYISTMNNACD